jgi:hypothetical protein
VLQRNKVRLWAVVGALAVVLGGCSGGGADLMTYLTPGRVPEPPPLVPTRYPERYKTQIADFMRSNLSNPGKVKDAFIGEPSLKPVGGAQPLYVTCVRYNPRDSTNQYEGNQTKLVIFLDGKLSQILPENPDMCRGLVYQRYPELEALGPP